MADPFLLAHQVGESVFDIGGKLYPVSVRDQMVRGQSIIDRAIAAGFGATGRELLVIGAGAAGTVAAIRAAAWGVHTHLIDADPPKRAPFGRQRGCTSRWIDPHEYEWPADHWLEASYPYTAPPLHPYYGHPVPVSWTAHWADALALGWSARFTQARHAYPHLHFYASTTLAPLPVPPPAYDAARGTWVMNLSNGICVSVGMVLNAVGVGGERCEVAAAGGAPTFRGLAFWETDRFRRPNCGLNGATVAQVVISGGGDGALQDFLRIMTRWRSVRRLYRAIAKEIPPDQRRRILAHIEGRIAGAENRAARSFLWGANDVHDHDVHRVLHLSHLHVVKWALSRPPVWSALTEVLPADPPDVRLIHPCNHFSQAYPLNRFLALLIDGYYAIRDKLPSRFIPGAEVTAVVGVAPHHCAIKRPRRCLGQLHHVSLGVVVHANCAGAWVPPTPPTQLQANIVIIRHGVTGIGPAPRLWGGLPPVGHPRHLLPIHCSR